MPVPVLKSLASKSGKSLAELEKYWAQAKASAEKEGKSKDYAYIVSIVKKMAGIKEKKKNLAIAFNLYTEALTIFAGDSYPEYKKLAAKGLEETRRLMD